MTEPTPPAEYHAVLTIRCHTERAQAEILAALATVAGELVSRVGVASVDLRGKNHAGRPALNVVAATSGLVDAGKVAAEIARAARLNGGTR